MEILSSKELNEVNGGGKSLWVVIGSIGTFIIGFISGFANPKACSSK